MIALHVTITRTGQTRYAYTPARSFRTFPMPRARAEHLIATGAARVWEIRDYLNGDGSPTRVADLAPAVVH